jgi:hypothetical protein
MGMGMCRGWGQGGGGRKLLVVFFLACREGVEHEHADCHGAHAAGYGGDETAAGCDLGELDVAVETEAALAGGVGNTGGAHIDDGGAFFHHVGRDEIGTSDGGDDDVGLSAFVLEGGAVAMADGDGGIAVALLHHELGHGFADDVAAPEDDALFAGGGDVIALQEGEDAFWRGGDIAWQSDCHAPHVDGMEAIDIFAVVDGFDDFLFGDVLGQGELHDETVDVGVVVELMHFVEQFSFADGVFEADEGGLEAARLAGNDFVFDVCLAAAVVAYEHGCEMGPLLTFGNHVGHLLCYFCFYLGCSGLSIDELHGVMCFIVVAAGVSPLAGISCGGWFIS